jgi:hypothetical protein
LKQQQAEANMQQQMDQAQKIQESKKFEDSQHLIQQFQLDLEKVQNDLQLSQINEQALNRQLRTKEDSYMKQKELLENEIVTLNDTIQTQKLEIELIEKELSLQKESSTMMVNVNVDNKNQIDEETARV